jgi:hypothetical protein
MGERPLRMRARARLEGLQRSGRIAARKLQRSEIVEKRRVGAGEREGLPIRALRRVVTALARVRMPLRGELRGLRRQSGAWRRVRRSARHSTVLSDEVAAEVARARASGRSC